MMFTTRDSHRLITTMLPQTMRDGHFVWREGGGLVRHIVFIVLHCYAMFV